MLAGLRIGTLRTNLIIHHGVMDVLNQATELIHILSAVQEPRDPAPLFQRDKVSMDIIQLPSGSCVSGQPSTLEIMGLPFEGLPPLFLLNFTLRNGCG